MAKKKVRDVDDLATPRTRTEEYLAHMAGKLVDLPAKQFSRLERYLKAIADRIDNGGGGGGGVTSFNGRTGAVVPAAGDYTPDMVGAAPLDKAIEPDNWFFPSSAVINQRGVSGTISTPGYFIDRWKLDSGSVELVSGGLTLNGAIQQIVDSSFPNIQTVTALATDGSLIDGTFDEQTNTVEFSASGKTIQAADFSPLSYPLRFRKSGATWEQVVSAPNVGDELRRCQRYYQRIGSIYAKPGTGYFNSATQAIVIIPLAAPLRTSLTYPNGISFSGTAYFWSTQGSGASAKTSTALNGANVWAGLNICYVTFTSSDLIPGLPCLLDFRDINSYIELSADV